MRLKELRTALTRILDDAAVDGDSPVIVEGWNEDGDVVQGTIESVSSEARCEGDDDHQAVYINLVDETEDDDDAPAADDVPIVHDFWEGVRAEKAHQIKRWGTTHDRNKAPADWFWLVGYLAGKALASAVLGDRDKALHHCISSAAVLAQWHDSLGGASESLKVEHDPSRASDLETHLGIEPEGTAP